MARSLIVWGTSSGAGKSLLATALCRWAAQRGIDVAPFKAQNMSNNARVVPGLDGAADGWGEIGAAQYFQALASRVPPHVDMNPVLLKPERDTASQVVVHGRVNPALSRMAWRERSALLAEAARESFQRLHSQHELIVVEGAGSPAETNLAPQDYVNLGVARWAREAGPWAGLLVTDIDRGGAFAHLLGTWTLLPEDLRPGLAGFVLNKFRGDAALLAPGPAQLQARTGVPTVAVLPMWREHGLPEEDGVFDAATAPNIAPSPPGTQPLHVAVVAYPRISNLDEFQPLRQVPGLRLSWAREAATLASADWIILPGSKQVSGDLHWLREQGLEPAIRQHVAAGKPVLGVCGGLQMLGMTLDDPHGFDGEPGRTQGLGLLSLTTHYRARKRVVPADVRFAGLAAPWAALEGIEAAACEIRAGVTEPVSGAVSGTSHAAVVRDAEGHTIGWQAGPVLGVYAHGLFESPAVMRALFGEARSLDNSLDGLAD